MYADTGKALTVDLPQTAKGIGSLVGDVLGITDGETLDAVGKFYADRYGTEEGFKKALAEKPAEVLSDLAAVTGGVGALEHLSEGIRIGGADAVLAASIFHFGEYSVLQAKEFMRERGIEVRL